MGMSEAAALMPIVGRRKHSFDSSATLRHLHRRRLLPHVGRAVVDVLESRRATVLLPADRIFRSPMHWLTQPGSNATGAANVIYITGPSRTADIEQQLNLGVHGPRELHVVIVRRVGRRVL